MAQQGRDEAGNIWNLDAQGNPTTLAQPARARSILTVAPPAYRVQQQQRDEGRKDQSQELDVSRFGLSRNQDARSAQTQPYDVRSAAATAVKNEDTARNVASDRTFDRADKLRADYEALPSVKTYTAALPVFGAGLRSGPDAAGDLNLIYAYAKVMDPNSVVREGEQASVAGGDTWVNQKTAQLQKQLGNGGTFQPEFRKRLRQEMAGRMGELNQLYIADRVRYKATANRNGVDVRDVVGDHPGARYQALSEQVLGKKQQQLDYNGMPIGGEGRSNGGEGPSPIPDEMRAFTLNNVVDFAAGITGGKYGFNEQRQLTYNGKAVDASADVLNSEPYQKAYRARFGEDPGLTVDVVGGSPAAKSELEKRRDTFGGGVDAVIRGAADTASLGLADPLAALMRSTFNDDGFAANLKRERAISATDEKVNPYLRFGGQMVGAIPTFAGVSRLGAAAVPARPFIGTAVADTAAGAVYGGASEMETSPVAGALVGGATALAGNQIGQRILSPLIQRALTPKEANTAILRSLSKPASAMDTGQVQATLRDADRLNLPMSLADADPKLRTVAGSATRLAPAGREYAERVIEPRGRGQAERAIAGIQRDFGPTVNIDEAADSLINKGRTASGGLYDEAYAAPVVATPELDAILATPAGRQALNRARTIAANERRDPAALGFSLDADGNVVLNPVRLDPFQAQAEAKSAFDAAQESHRVALRTAGANTETTRESLLAARDQLKTADASLANAPTPGTAATSQGYTTQTLDYVKRGLDDILEQSRDPVTRRLHLDEAGRAVNDVRASLVKEVDNLNPRYAEARAAYEGPAKERDALLVGRNAVGPQTTPDRLGRMTTGRTNGQMDHLRTGFRTGMAEQVDRMRFSGNPYDAIYGTPDQVAKVGVLFPEGADNFARQTDLERMMAKTQQETLGGSPTAGRRAADEMFAPGMGAQLAGETALGTLAGVPPVSAVARALTGTLGDRFRMGFGGSKKAESIAQLLLDPNPRAGMATVDALVAQEAARARALAIGGSAGAASAIPVLSSYRAE